MNETTKILDNTSKQLQEVRDALLGLHKTLLDFERKQYEGTYGKIASTGKFFEVVTSHPSFTWLRQLSELIVSIDEFLEQKESATHKNIEGVFAYTATLVQAAKSGTKFSEQYYSAIQKDPAVALAHAKVINGLKCKTSL